MTAEGSKIFQGDRISLLQLIEAQFLFNGVLKRCLILRFVSFTEVQITDNFGRFAQKKKTTPPPPPPVTLSLASTLMRTAIGSSNIRRIRGSRSTPWQAP